MAIGEADGAFVYATDALLAKKAKVILHVPEELHDRIVYPMAVTASGLKNAAAKEFAAYLSGPEAKAVLEKYGFEVEN
ncbi:substrate-binding domain-containing protein [Desulfobulbus sp. F5]|nr:substrate-binding domain-containing protein [Desulfobulbus sp. F5]